MNKSVFSVLLVAVLGMCSLNAGETISQKPATNLQKQELEMLFGANANASDLNVAVLSEEELKEIKGDFLPAFAIKLGIGAGIGLVKWGYCRFKGGSGCPFQVNVNYPLN